jgi:hypothetical protein
MRFAGQENMAQCWLCNFRIIAFVFCSKCNIDLLQMSLCSNAITCRLMEIFSLNSVCRSRSRQICDISGWVNKMWCNILQRLYVVISTQLSLLFDKKGPYRSVTSVTIIKRSCLYIINYISDELCLIVVPPGVASISVTPWSRSVKCVWSRSAKCLE